MNVGEIDAKGLYICERFYVTCYVPVTVYKGVCVCVCVCVCSDVKRLAEKEDWIVDNEGLTSLVNRCLEQL